MRYLIIKICLFLVLDSLGQSNILIGQYFQLMPVFAPGLTGSNDFLDIRVGMRNQWVGYEGAPKTYFVSGSGVVSISKTNPHKFNSVRVSDLSPYKSNGVKLGVGGYVINDELGEFKQLESMISVAIHVPVSKTTYLSLGLSGGYYNTKLDLTNVHVLRPQNDNVYQDYLVNSGQSNYLKLNAGISLYSDRFYLSYAPLNLVNRFIDGASAALENTRGILHHLLGGFRFSPSEKFEIIPNFYFRYADILPVQFDVGTRVRYQQNMYLGVSYRNDQSIVSMIGFTLGNLYTVGYSFEHKMMDYDGFNSNSHEIIVGIQLFNHKKYTPIW